MEKSTDGLVSILSSANPSDLKTVLENNKDELVEGEKPFYQYLRELLTIHGKTQVDVISKAGFSNKYGYRLLSGDKHTVQRDYFLRICIAGEFTLDEAQRLLKLYGFSPLYPRIKRDAALINFISSGIYEIRKVNDELINLSLTPLKTSEEKE